MWTAQNTEGFNADELAMINRVSGRIALDAAGIDTGNIYDAINNAWIDGATEEDLETAARKALGLEA